MNLHFFTFGVGHLLRRHYVIIAAQTAEEARTEMVHQFGTCWSWQYSEAEWADRAPRYFADLVPIGTLTGYGYVQDTGSSGAPIGGGEL